MNMLAYFLRQNRALILLSILALGLILGRSWMLWATPCDTWWPCPRILFFFLIWNLALAWMSLFLGYLLRRTQRRWLHACGLLAWLLFFPNAPYLITDLIHLRARAGIPLWYDALLLFLFAYIGLQLGMIALRQIRAWLSNQYALHWANAFTALTLLLSGLGIYLGRVSRWNSWDAVLHPLGPLREVMDMVLHPLYYTEAWGMISVFTLVLSVVYWSGIGYGEIEVLD